MTDWYERRHELEEGMVCRLRDGCIIKLDHRVEGDGTQWAVADWMDARPDISGYELGYWSYDEGTIEPGDINELLPNWGK